MLRAYQAMAMVAKDKVLSVGVPEGIVISGDGTQGSAEASFKPSTVVERASTLLIQRVKGGGDVSSAA